MQNDNTGLNAYQAELARLLRLSTITPGRYAPSEEVKSGFHAAVFVGDTPVILCGPSTDPLSAFQAAALSSSNYVLAAFFAAGKFGAIRNGVVAGSHVPWSLFESAIVSKPSGQVELGNDDGPLLAIVCDDPQQALTTGLCVTTETARIFDVTAPELDDGRRLPLLANASRQKRPQTQSATSV